MEYSSGRSDPRLEAKDFDTSYHSTVVAAGTQGSVLKLCILHVLQSLPEREVLGAPFNGAHYGASLSLKAGSTFI